MNKSKCPLTIILALALALSSVGCVKAPAAAPGDDPREAVLVSEFPSDFQLFSEALDTGFSKRLMEALSALGQGGPGFRTAGSPLEREAADLVEAAMREAGLTSIGREAVYAGAWVFTGAALSYDSFKGEAAEIGLGGYPATASFHEAPLLLEDLGAGTAADYAGKDVAGKAVLLDADPAAWGAAYPACQARVKGAAAVLVNSLGLGEGSAMATQGLSGMEGFPVLAISAQGAAALRRELRLSQTGSLTVRLSAESWAAKPSVGPPSPGGGPYLLWGDIPGKTEEVIYVSANYDGLYGSAFYGASGLATALAMARPEAP